MDCAGLNKPRFLIGVFVLDPRRLTRSGENVPIMSWWIFDRSDYTYALRSALELAKWNKYRNAWIGETTL